MGIASKLDRHIQLQRVTLVPDGLGGGIETWADHGEEIPALREDVKDSEAVAAGVFRSKLMTRFLVRSTEFTRGLTTDDRLSCEGDLFGIVGIKEPSQGQRRQLIEITGETIT